MRLEQTGRCPDPVPGKRKMEKPVEDGDDEEGEDKGGYKEGEDEHGHDHGDGGDDVSRKDESRKDESRKDESRKDESSGDYNDDYESDNHSDKFADATSESNGTTETLGAEEKTLQMVEQLVKINHKCISRPATVVVVNVIITTKCSLPNEGA
ncbi:hypothetical protein CSPX01_11053 [Colletotrichum filicis]|nr:hypothetical protein CSPX01_11053 [Colletotrichum filicis]